jgi:8-oxo-dGTP pyrophosphatase MutT (NUDIX family)
MARTQQVAALPWRQGVNGLEILLVTTRTTKRWVIPKGWTMAGKADHEAAAIEAYEEAGVKGHTLPTPVGSYGYLKVLRNGAARRVNVKVYALHVKDLLDAWPESHERQRQWVTKDQALTMIGEPELLPIVAAFDGGTQTAPTAHRGASGLLDRLKKWWCKLFG